MNNSHENEPISTTRLREALHRVVLLRETGPKSAAWHRARVQTIWRLHTMLAEQRGQEDDPAPHHPDSSNSSSG
jgi:hypothetical protein